ncbi:hypothetical protein HMI54_015706 [Coelomomyces lativittatus]|nr:hypothetical protein HMI54_015706 [Coelomomyces lativittatus]
MPVSVPDVVRCQVNQACGFQPRDSSSSQSYMLQEPVDGVLAATAEIPLVGMYANTSIPISALPLRMVAMGHAFRKESGARGNDTKGLFRVHQFSKVELVVVSTQDQSNHLFNTLIQLQKNVLEQLGLTFRVLEMPTSELGAPAYRKIDMEAWIPGRQVWGEVSSASHCTDFQARRLNLRLDNNQSPEPFLHTLNGTCAAIPRLIIAILEQFQQQDGTVKVPEVLQPYLNTDVIRPPN